ncbi:helix-turn-helix transcriptional regulator [Achromobacter xylosoxidans]
MRIMRLPFELGGSPGRCIRRRESTLRRDFASSSCTRRFYNRRSLSAHQGLCIMDSCPALSTHIRNYLLGQRPMRTTMTQSVPHAAPVAPRHHSPGLAAQDRFLRMHQVCEICGLSRSAIYGRIKLGLFPAQVQLGPKSVAWLASDISNWMQARIAARNH